MDVTGKIIAILPAQSGVSQRSGNAWMKQEYVLEIPGQWPRHVCFGVFGEDRIKQFNIQPGEENITVQFDIDAREYQGRWFNEIRAYNVIRGTVGQQPYAGQPAYSAQQTAPAAQPLPPKDPPF